jgi:NTP pyrophosphatase (non-canonical NTP hydrolase)
LAKFNALNYIYKLLKFPATFTDVISKPKRLKHMEEIIKTLIQFRNERDWAQFHNPKDLAIAINIEASELLEQFLWKHYDEADKEKVKEELADVFAFAFLLADKYDFDVKEIILEKIKKNGEKYPINKSKGTAKKYNEL